MGKSFKKRFRGICCLSESSSDTTNGIQNTPTKSKNATDMEMLREEVDELGDKLKALKESLDAVEEKCNATEREIGAFFSQSLVEKMAEMFTYRTPPMMAHSMIKVCNDVESKISSSFYPTIAIKDENENLSDRQPFPTKSTAEATTTVIQVPSLIHYCRRMFCQIVTSNEDTHQHREFFTDLATRYNLVALQNVGGCVNIMDPEEHHLLSLRQICHKLFGHESTGELREGKAARLSDTGETYGLSGSFGQTSSEGFGLAVEKQHSMEIHFLDISGLSTTIQPLESMQVFLHHELMTTLNFPFRVTLRDLMLKNKFDESHAKFLCVNLLITLKHLHGQNMIHGHISPSKVIFTQYGYPCLTGVETSQTEVDTFKPKTRIDFTSPEQVKAQPITQATDVFLAGILVYSMVHGKSPFKADTYHQTKTNLLNEDFTPEFEPCTFSKDGRYFIRKLLKINPNDRFKLDKCRRPLDKAVRWFNSLNQQELFSQTCPSPFKIPLMREIIAD